MTAAPRPVGLDEEQRAALKCLLLRAEPGQSQRALETLAAGVEASMTEYLKQSASAASFRTTHDELRGLWVLVVADDPPVGVIRQRLLALHPASQVALERLAQWLWPKLLSGDPPAGGVMKWGQTAPAQDLLLLVRTALVEGGLVVCGRRRPGGRRSASRLEPVILGVVRGAPGHQPVPANGRPPDDLAVQLIAFLAVDWAQATDEMPQSGRSDRTAFGDLVHQVFGWLERPDATGALRRYWRKYRHRKVARA